MFVSPNANNILKLRFLHSTSINFRHRICKNLKIMTEVYQLEGEKNWRFARKVGNRSVHWDFTKVSSFGASFTADIGNFNRRSRFHWASRFSIFWQRAIVSSKIWKTNALSRFHRCKLIPHPRSYGKFHLIFSFRKQISLLIFDARITIELINKLIRGKLRILYKFVPSFIKHILRNVSIHESNK